MVVKAIDIEFDYIPKETRKKFKLGEYADDSANIETDDSIEAEEMIVNCGGIKPMSDFALFDEYEKGAKMLGAIYGDIVGSVYEFNNIKTKDFELFTKESKFTDDTVLTLAVAKALCKLEDRNDVEAFKKSLIKAMHELAEKYFYAGYGYRFFRWILSRSNEPYGSFGNGSAMRVSPVAWYASSLEECLYFAKASAEVTHDHPDGIKGAVVTAGATYLARTGGTMSQIKDFVGKYYKIDFTLDEIRPTYKFNETCQGSVPQAMEAFFESTSFEDAIRNAICIGGDSDTIAAIAGSVAEAYYGMSDEQASQAKERLPAPLLDIYEEFEKIIFRKRSIL